jgi:hypothetical protein
MAPLEDASRDWRDRMLRVRRLADLLRADPAAGRLVALAQEIEQGLLRLSETAAIAQETRRHSAVIRAEMAGIVARSRSELFFAKHFLRNHRYSADDLREESRLCREEASASEEGEARQELAASAFQLAMMGEAISRAEKGGAK